MTGVKAFDLAYVRIQGPDLAKGEAFLEAFGLQTVATTDRAVYSRGTDAGGYCHVLQLGPPRFFGAAFLVDSPDSLENATRIEGASAITARNEPGGGHAVTLTDPNGFVIELVHGIEHYAAIDVEQFPVNTGEDRLRRAGTAYRRPPGPSRVKRIGHFVIGTPDVKVTRAWYRETLGLLATDDVWAGEPEHVIATFSRLARGAEFVDHHVFMAHEDKVADLNHFGFEVQDYDDIFFGHYFMKEGGHEHRWGLGRHRLGSQVYNQWTDPWGRGYEHWTDTDVLNADHEAELWPASVALKSQWGEPQPKHLLRAPD